jgi:hypothetical protein
MGFDFMVGMVGMVEPAMLAGEVVAVVGVIVAVVGVPPVGFLVRF